jgi:hypothetical protein
MSTSPGETPPNIGDEKKVDDKKNKNEEKEIESSDEDFDYNSKSVKVTKKGSSKTFAKIPFNYGRLSSSSQSASANLGKPPRFDGMGYSSWRHSMHVYSIGVNPDLWKIVCRCQHSQGG